MDHPVLLLSRKKAAARWGTLARCFAARRLPKTELSTVVLPHVTQSFSRGVPRELAEISQFEDKGRNSIDLKNISKILTNILSKSYNKSEEISSLYRVTLVVEYLGWVDLDLGCSTILLGQ